ncbi:MAG: choice-of-anchor B family protein [Bacteroidota bacterium]
MNRRFIWFLVVLIFGFVMACGSDDSGDAVMVDDGTTMTDDDAGTDDDMGTTDDAPMPPTMGFNPCQNGMAGEFPCDGYDLLGRIQHSTFSAASGNDIWGWTDTTTGNEYALVGLDNGTAFVDISDTDNLIYLGKLPTATTSSIWRDVKVYGNHAFIVSEANSHGMQVFDLTQLRNVSSPPQTFSADARYTAIGNAHNVVINEEMGFAYPVGTARNDAFSGGVHFVDIGNPTSPTGVGGYGTNGYTHDAQVVTYAGPDSDYSGREIFIGANEDFIAIVDITNKSDPVEISTLNYSQLGYTHQGWFTEDQRYFLLGDELDEVQFGFNSRTLIFDFTDLDSPQFHMEYLGPTAAIDHNGYVKGDEFFLANYTAGMRVLDIGAIESRSVSEIAFFDTFPSNNGASFDGVWSVYPYFESGKIVINDGNTGFFVVRKSE